MKYVLLLVRIESNTNYLKKQQQQNPPIYKLKPRVIISNLDVQENRKNDWEGWCFF